MKVLHITTCDFGGAGLCCLRIHQSLLNVGIESKVVTLINTKHAEEEYQYGFFKYKINRIISKFLRTIGLVVSEQNKIIRLSKENGGVTYSLPTSPVNILQNKWVKWADVIHLHWVGNYLDYPSFFNGINKPVVWTLHDEYFFFGIAHYSNQVLNNNQEKKYYQMKCKALSHVKNLSVVLLSDYFFRKFRNHELLIGRNVKVINNSVDTQVFIPVSKKKAREKYGIRSDEVVFVFISMLITDQRKGLDLLSNVLIDINPNIKILAIGNNPNNVSWPNVISVGSLSNYSDISETLSAADYYAMPSCSEAFAQSPLEAMACGLPAVVFPVSGTSELINECNGVICDGFTFEALKKGIQILMNHKYNSEEIRQDMINRFSPESIAQKYIDLYNTMLK